MNDAYMLNADLYMHECWSICFAYVEYMKDYACNMFYVFNFHAFSIICMHVHVHGAICRDDLMYSNILFSGRRAEDVTYIVWITFNYIN